MARRASVLYERTVLIDTSAIIALFEPTDRFHIEARQVFAEEGLSWVSADVTAHEIYTRVRYDRGYSDARSHFNFLRSDPIKVVHFNQEDEDGACALLMKYAEHKVSFHDALCAAMMLRLGIYRVFTFDKDFWIMGFEILPGYV